MWKAYRDVRQRVRFRCARCCPGLASMRAPVGWSGCPVWSGSTSKPTPPWESGDGARPVDHLRSDEAADATDQRHAARSTMFWARSSMMRQRAMLARARWSGLRP